MIGIVVFLCICSNSHGLSQHCQLHVPEEKTLEWFHGDFTIFYPWVIVYTFHEIHWFLNDFCSGSPCWQEWTAWVHRFSCYFGRRCRLKPFLFHDFDGFCGNMLNMNLQETPKKNNVKNHGPWFPVDFFYLVGGLVAIFYFPIYIGNVIIPIDVPIFKRGSNHQPVTNPMIRGASGCPEAAGTTETHGRSGCQGHRRGRLSEDEEFAIENMSRS